MGELGQLSLPNEIFLELSTAFDQVLAECNSYIKTNYFSVTEEIKPTGAASDATAVDGGKGDASPVATTPCSMCGRKFLPERLVSAFAPVLCRPAGFRR